MIEVCGTRDERFDPCVLVEANDFLRTWIAFAGMDFQLQIRDLDDGLDQIIVREVVRLILFEVFLALGDLEPLLRPEAIRKQLLERLLR